MTRPLRFAREPIPSRCVRWLRRNRRRLAVAAPLVLALGVSVYSLVGAQFAALRLEAEVRHWVDEGRHSAAAGQLELAVSHFDTAARLARRRSRVCKSCTTRSSEEERLARETKEIRDKADELFEVGERLRFSLLGFRGDLKVACRWVESALASFSIPDDPDWMRRVDRAARRAPARPPGRRGQRAAFPLGLRHGPRVAPRPGGGPPGRPDLRRGAGLRHDGRALAGDPGALRRDARRRAGPPPRCPPAPKARRRPAVASSGRSCATWRSGTEAAVAWLERATLLEPSDYWSQFYLGTHHWRLGQNGRAMEHYQAAVALRPDSPWARCNRAVLYHARGDWDRALDDLNRALASPQGADFLEARLELGVVKQVLGDDAGAPGGLRDRSSPRGNGQRPGASRPAQPCEARLRRRRRRPGLGRIHGVAGRGSARRPGAVEPCPAGASGLDRAAQCRGGSHASCSSETPERADEILARRALARLALGRLEGAEEDAAGAYRRKPSPSRERLWVRTLLALRRVEDLFWLSRPDDLTILPGGGPSLMADLREADERLRSIGRGNAARDDTFAGPPNPRRAAERPE